MILLSIDPATHGTACALWRDGTLIAAGYAPNKLKEGDIVQRCAASAKAAFEWFLTQDERLRTDGYIQLPNLLVVELPQIYQRGANKTKGDPNKTCLPLAMVDAALSALLPLSAVRSIEPHSWKGTTEKPKKVSEPEYVITKRVKERLTPTELAAIEWGKSIERTWDIADAIGVGLHHLGRFERGRVLPRD